MQSNLLSGRIDIPCLLEDSWGRGDPKGQPSVAVRRPQWVLMVTKFNSATPHPTPSGCRHASGPPSKSRLHRRVRRTGRLVLPVGTGPLRVQDSRHLVVTT